MKAPDKIFLGIGSMSGDEPDKRYLYAEWYEEQKPLVQNIAYLRKDVLLKWAKEELSKANVSSSSIERRNAFIDVLIDMIDKLNSI